MPGKNSQREMAFLREWIRRSWSSCCRTHEPGWPTPLACWLPCPPNLQLLLNPCRCSFASSQPSSHTLQTCPVLQLACRTHIHSKLDTGMQVQLVQCQMSAPTYCIHKAICACWGRPLQPQLPVEECIRTAAALRACAHSWLW